MQDLAVAVLFASSALLLSIAGLHAMVSQYWDIEGPGLLGGG
jgi:hypothetical protein